MNTKTFVARNNIRASAEWADWNPDLHLDEERREGLRKPGDDMNHWKVTLRHGRKRMTVHFSMGLALTGEPTAADVLDCLASDAASYVNASGFEDWCSDLGYDTDSRKAERTYKIVKRQAERLETLLGTDLYESLLWDTERL